MIICWKHETVSAWRCPQCRQELMDKAIERAIQEPRRDIKEAFRDKREGKSDD